MSRVSFLNILKSSIFKRINYLFIKSFFSMKQKSIFLIDKKAIIINLPQLFSLKLYSPFKEDISENLCISSPEIYTFSLNGDLKVEKVTDNLLDYFLQAPSIYYFDVNLEKPLKKGRLYTEEKTNEDQKKQRLFNYKEQFEKCIHGTIKNWCSICKEKKLEEETQKQLKLKQFNIFDLIFPILQPPLGDNFDNQIVIPEGKSLYNFQIFGVKFLVENNRALLGDEMGLGKSIQAIMALRLLYRQAILKYGLIICPKSVLIDWEKKLKEWAPELRTLTVHGHKNLRKIYWNSPAHIHLATYDTIRIDLTDLYDKNISDKNSKINNYDFTILDEIQRIKNPNTETTKTIKRIDTQIRWGLSGTPLENKTEELIAIFSYLIPGFLKYEDANRQTYIKEKIKPHFLRRRLKDAMPDLPEKIQEDIWLDLNENQRNTYEITEREGVIKLTELGDKITAQNIISLINQLKQICNIDPNSSESCKFEYLYEKLDEIIEHDAKALVFSQFPNVTLKLIEPKLQRFNPLFFDGSLSETKRDEYVEKFQNDNKNKIMLMSVKAGSQGITLTRANFVYHFDHWWNPATSEQAEGRAHRIGQSKPVLAFHLYTTDTIEERIYDLLEKKKHIFKYIIDDLSDTESIKKILTFEELLGLFNLKKPDKYSYH